MNDRLPVQLVTSHLSASQLSTYLRCPKSYFFRYIAKKAPSHQSAALAFGRAWGATIAHHLEHSTPDALVPVDDLTDLFRAELDQELAETPVPVLFDDQENLDGLTATARRMLAVFQAEVPLPEKFLGAEVAFSVPVVHPEHGEELPLPLVGALDALVVEHGRTVVWELKTAKKKYSSIQLELEMLQPVVYTVGARHLGIEDPEVVVIVTTKGKQPGVQIERLRRHQTDEVELFDLAEQVIRAVEAGVHPRNRSWACTTCPYRADCAP